MEESKAKQWSVGRFDFSLPEQFILAGRNQSIYTVKAETRQYSDQSPATLWQLYLKKITAENVSQENPEVIVWQEELSPGFNVASYRTDMDLEVITYTAQKAYEDEILVLTCEGKIGFEEDILHLIKFTAQGYKTGVFNGFNVGAGSIISQPSVFEQAFASFENPLLNMEVSFNSQTVGEILNDHPLEDVQFEKKSLSADGIMLNVLQNDKRNLANIPGYEGLVTVDFPEDESVFRYTWFHEGVPGDSFKPEILVKMSGPAKHLELAGKTWEALLNSFMVRAMY